VDVTPLLELRPAPRAVLDRLPTHRDRPRFWVRGPSGPGGPGSPGSQKSSGWQPVTWGQYAQQIRGVARWLIERGIAPGDRVAIFAPNSVAWASASLGAQAAGAVFVPIYPASTAEQVAYILEHAEVRCVFVAGAEPALRLEQARARLAAPSGADAPARGDHAINVVDLESASWDPAAPATPAPDTSIRGAAARDAADPSLVDARLRALSLDAPAQMLYTSGTSGNPKGVPLTHRNVGRNGADWLVCNAPLLAEGDRDLLWLPMSHIFGFGEVCIGNLLAWETYLASPGDVLERLPEVAPDVFFSVPAYWEKLARAALTDPDRDAPCAASPAAGSASACPAAPASRSRSNSSSRPAACSSSRATG
jgi:long-chain acyl-CoA synthetase